MPEKTVLLGLHDEGVAKAYARFCRACGYTPTLVRTKSEMVARVTSEQYTVYIMDANLDNPGAVNIGPAVEVYNLIVHRVTAGEARFVAVSAEVKTVELARQQGLPAEMKDTKLDLEAILI